MLTPTQFLETIKRRSFQLIPLKNRQGTVEWTCKTINGSRAAPSNSTYSTPEEAVEAADLHFTASETRENDRKSHKLISSLETGDYYIKQKQGTVTDPDGNPVSARLFDVLNLDGTPTSVTDRRSLSQAILDIEEDKRNKLKPSLK